MGQSSSSILLISGGVISFISGAYIIANTSLFHKGKSGFGSCTTALEVARDAYPSGSSGQAVIVTGANSGIGKETARALAMIGMHVIIPCRTLGKAENTIQDISESCHKLGILPPTMTPAVLDLSDMISIDKFANQIRTLGLPITAIICNAGIMALPERQLTAQGFEMQIGVCHLGHFRLVTQLITQLKAAKNARVVMVSSMGHRLADTTEWIYNSRLETSLYDPWKYYGYAKMSNILFAHEMNERYANDGITAYSLHPGGIHTNLQSHVSWRTALFWALVTPFFFKSKQQGAATSVFCAIHPKALPYAGEYFSDCNVAKVSEEKQKWMKDDKIRKKLWDTSEILVNQHFIKMK